MKHCLDCMPLLLAFLLVVISSEAVTGFPQLKHFRPRASPTTQAAAAKNLIIRLIKERAADFYVNVNESIGPEDRDTFQLSTASNGSVQIVGTSGVAAAMGFYYYLKYYCKGQRTWAGQQTQLPPTLPVIGSPVKISTNDKFRYYQNVCTQSYTMAFWNWTRWEQEIDWMALHGINLPLAFVGQEAIFQRVYLSLGFTQADLDEYFGGPAFLAWARMGNIQGWGGPLPQTWINKKLLLQHKILERMRSLGMVVVLPGFAGHVPSSVTRLFPHANVTHLPNWNTFNATYSGTYLLGFQDPLFIRIGQLFIHTMIDEFGTDHIYSCDTFNEMDPISNDPSYLSAAGKGVFNGMLAGDPQAVWLMQGWLFQDYLFWQPAQVKALVTSVPQGRMIILDMCSDLLPIYQKHKSYYGQPFIWCMLHNFGGTLELYGAIDNINKGPAAGREFPNSTMIGIGLTPEGLHQNEVMYEFMTENSWRTEPSDVSEWVESFAIQRYGTNNSAVNSAWQLLMKSVYNCTDNHLDIDYVIITRRPSTYYRPELWYDSEDLFTAWDSFITASQDLEGSELFLYDLTDITRNSLQVIANSFYAAIVDAFSKKDIAAVQSAGQSLTSLLYEMDILLASDSHFLVGQWIADAKSWGQSENDTKLFEYNARNQITLWGPRGEIHDYASKQWSGVTADYFVPRWQLFTQWLVQLIQNGTSWDDNVFGEYIMQAVETPWTVNTTIYPTEALGSTIQIATYLYERYRPVSQDPVFHDLLKTGNSKQEEKQHDIFSKKLSSVYRTRRADRIFY